MKRRSAVGNKRKNKAVTEIIGTMLLLGISVSLFTIVYISVLSVPSTPPTPSANIVCEVSGENLTFFHVGGTALSENTRILLTVDGEDTSATVVVKNNMSSDARADRKWGFGEQVKYFNSSFFGRQVSFSIVDIDTNSIVTTGTISINPIITFVQNIIPYAQTGSSVDLSAASKGEDPDNVTLWYRWTGFWQDSFTNDDAHVSSYHNMSFDEGDYVVVNRSGAGENIIHYVNKTSDDYSPSEKGTHSNFDNMTEKDGDYDTLTEENTGIDFLHYVNKTSDDYSPSEKGTHSNIPGQQEGPDGIFDALTETEGASWLTPTNIEDCYDVGGSTANAMDDNTNTYWQHNYNHDHWIEFDMGQTYSISRARIYQSSSWYYYRWGAGGTVSVYVSDDPDAWGSAVTTGWNAAAGSGWQSTTFPSKSGRYVRLEEVGGYNRNYHLMYEFDAYCFGSCELDLEVQWTNVDHDETNERLSIYLKNGSNTHSLDCSGGYMKVGNGNVDWGSTTGTISFWVKLDTVDGRPWGQSNSMETRFEDNKLKLDWGYSYPMMVSDTIFTTDKWYFIAIVWNENANELYLYIGDEDNPPTVDVSDTNWYYSVSDVSVDENNFMKSGSGYSDPIYGYGDDLRYWDTDRSLTEIQNDYKTELTGSESDLKSYFKLNNNFDDIGLDNNDGSGSGSYSFSSDAPFGAPPTENIRVDVWNGSDWENVFPYLEDGWNNASVSSWLNSDTFTIRFKGTNELSDNIQDSWHIDCSLLHLWSVSNYELDLEVQWTDINYNLNLINEKLCIFAGTVGDENLSVQVWNTASPAGWDTVISNLSSGWNNESIKEWLTSPTFTIRYNASNETSDSTSQDSWKIDVALLHLWEPGTGIYYKGNITSILITKTNNNDWNMFYADVNNTVNSTFSILDENGVPMPGYQDLDGNGNDISSIGTNKLKLFGSFDGAVRLNSWNATLVGEDWTEYSSIDEDGTDGWSWNDFSFEDINEGFSLFYWFYSIGKKSGWPDENIPRSPNYDATCKYVEAYT